MKWTCESLMFNFEFNCAGFLLDFLVMFDNR